MEKTMQEVLNLIKEVSPEVWAILIKQVYVEVFGKFLWGSAMLFAGYALYRKSIGVTDEVIKWVLACIIGSFGFLGFLFFLSALKWLIHPEFYALRFILWQFN